MVYRNDVSKMNLPCEHRGCTGCMLKYWSIRYLRDRDFDEIFRCPYCRAETVGLRPKEGRDLTNIPFVRDKHTTQIVEDVITEVFKVLDEEADMIGTLGYPEELKQVFEEWGSPSKLQREIWVDMKK